MKSEVTVAVCFSVLAILVLSSSVTEALPRCRPGSMLCRQNGRDVVEKPNRDLVDVKDTRESMLRRRQMTEGNGADYEIEERVLRKLKRFLDSRQ